MSCAETEHPKHLISLKLNTTSTPRRNVQVVTIKSTDAKDGSYQVECQQETFVRYLRD